MNQALRQAEHAEKFLEGFSRCLHTDGCQGCHKLPGNIRVVGLGPCMKEVRRGAALSQGTVTVPLQYLEDGRLELSNNRAECSIKPFVIGRKNLVIIFDKRKLLEDIKLWLASVGLKLKGTWQIFRVGFTPLMAKAHEALSEKKQRHRRPRMPSALGYRFGHGYTIPRKHNLKRSN